MTKIIQMILNKVEEEAQQESLKPHTLGVYRASEIGGCGRALQYATLKYKAEPLTPETYMIFQDGHLHHRAVRETLGKIGTVSNVEMTISKKFKHKDERFIITGTIDLVYNGIVIDIKSISTYRFKYLNKAFPQEYMNYVYQVNTYMNMLDLDKGGILFKDKNTAELKFFELAYSEDLMTEILDKIIEIQKGCKTKKLIPRPYDRDSWQCKLCQYRLACWKLPMEKRHWEGSQASQDAQAKALKAKLRESIREAGLGRQKRSLKA